ncbi:uncharacterized protein LOC135227046 [Macrobrachium nipponense]|uniref:uncharacterized protein LOC135227046 n=1 Tax=Macrobrachium nipponense TaxID=159736 RepID=UPI0030C894D1
MWAPMVTVLLGVLDSALAGQILSYEEAQHSRSEAGVPGTNVTGKWSWVDSRGQQHHVWYIADTGGFRAFGDLVPSDRQQPSFLEIGTPVIGGRPGLSSSGEDPVAKSLPSVLPEKEPIPIGTPVLGGPRRTSDSHTGNHFSVLGFPEISQVEAALKAEARATTVSPATILEAAVAIDSTQLSRTEGSQEVFGQSAHGQRNDASSQNKGSQEENSDTKEGLSKSMSSTGGENVLAQRMLGKAIATFSISSENKRTLLTPSDMQREIQQMALSMEVLPIPEKNSDFVLIDRLRVPTEPKPRVGPPQIVPQPVSVQNPSTRVIMGLHTSGRPPTADRLTQPSRNLAPLGIHLLNLVPFRSNSKSLNSNGPVPKPIRVVGAPNLENFYRPATLARTTPSPFRLPNPIRDYDYFYSDYDYYDYANYDTGSPAGGPQSTKRASNSAKDNSDESENSAEPEGVDSDEMDE